MTQGYRFVYMAQPEWGMVGGGISDYNAEQAGEEMSQNLCYVLLAPDGEVVAGVIGATHWNWLYINLMWVRKDLRGCGYGSRLLELAEQEARKRGARDAYLDTFSFQAPEFYKRRGYHVFGELQDFPTGHTRYNLTKKL